MSVRGVLFDLDGTLVDTAPDLGGAANALRAARGLAPLTIERYRPVASSGARGLLRVGLELTPDDAEYAPQRERFLEIYRANLARDSRLFPGIDAVLRRLEASGVAWGVVTNKPSWLTRPLLQQLRLDARCACAISPEEAGKPKPAPDGLLLACRLLGLAPAEALYVGDDRRDIEAARAARMRSVAVEWGYVGEDGPIDSWHADHLVTTPAGLESLVFGTALAA
jgi:phosphoglycolate phosphatase